CPTRRSSDLFPLPDCSVQLLMSFCFLPHYLESPRPVFCSRSICLIIPFPALWAYFRGVSCGIQLPRLLSIFAFLAMLFCASYPLLIALSVWVLSAFYIFL